MKKKLLVTLMAGVMAFGLMACGDKEEAAKEPVVTETEAKPEVETKTEAPEVQVEEAVEEVEVEEVASEEEGFSILDVSTDMIQAGYYTCDEDGNEMVVSLFVGPDGLNYVSLIEVPADGAGDIICGSYTADDVKQTYDEENGVTWTTISFVDAYTDGNCVVVFGDGDDGSCGIANEDFSIAVEGNYLTADETINYMGAAVNYIE